MPILLALVAIAAGILNTLQTGANASLNKALDQPILAAFIVAFTNAGISPLAAPSRGLGGPGSERIAAVPWWAWLGGAMGGIYVLAMILLADRLGAAIFTGLTVTAAIIASLVLDHFGWLGFVQHTAGPW